MAGSPLYGPANSVFFVQNGSTALATCTYTLYDAFGTGGVPQTFTVPANDRRAISIADITGISLNTSGTAEVNCNQPVVVVSLYSNPPTGGTNSSGAAFEGRANTSGTWYAPENYNDYYGYSSHIIVYNTSSSNATASARFYDPSGNVVGDCGLGVPAHAAVMIEPRGCGSVANNVSYSAVIYSSSGLVPVVNWYALNNPQLGSYTPVSAGASTLYIPYVFNNFYGFNTALIVQNLGSTTTNITVWYYNGTSETKSGIAPNAAALFFPSGFVPANSSTSAWVTNSNSQPLAAIENEGGPNNRAGSFTGFSAGSLTAYAPHMAYNFVGYDSSITCQNVGSSATNLTINYIGTSVSSTFTNVQPRESKTFWDNLQFPNGWSGAAKVTSTSQPIACVVAMDQNKSPYFSTTNMDQTYLYNAFTSQDLGTNVHLPLLFAGRQPKQGLPRLSNNNRRFMAEWGYVYLPPSSVIPGVDSVPMVGTGCTAEELISGTRQLGGNSQWILGFNEPENIIVDDPSTPCDERVKFDAQGNLNYGRMADLWHQFEAKITSGSWSGKLLVSPAPVNGSYGLDTNPLQLMLNYYQSKGWGTPRFDALAVHDYFGDFADGQSKVNAAITWADTHGYSGKPIWVTEFGTPYASSGYVTLYCPGQGYSNDRKQVLIQSPSDRQFYLPELWKVRDWMQNQLRVARFAQYVDLIEACSPYSFDVFHNIEMLHGTDLYFDAGVNAYREVTAPDPSELTDYGHSYRGLW